MRAPYSYNGVVMLPDGDTLIFGSTADLPGSAQLLYSSANPHQQIVLAALGSVPFQNGEPPDLLPALGESENDVPVGAAVDPSGNIWIAGNTDSDDFNLVNPIVPQKVPYRRAGFILELDPTGTKLLFSTYLAGQLRSKTTCPACYTPHRSQRLRLGSNATTGMTIDQLGIGITGDTSMGSAGRTTGGKQVTLSTRPPTSSGSKRTVHFACSSSSP